MSGNRLYQSKFNPPRKKRINELGENGQPGSLAPYGANPVYNNGAQFPQQSVWFPPGLQPPLPAQSPPGYEPSNSPHSTVNAPSNSGQWRPPHGSPFIPYADTGYYDLVRQIPGQQPQQQFQGISKGEGSRDPYTRPSANNYGASVNKFKLDDFTSYSNLYRAKVRTAVEHQQQVMEEARIALAEFNELLAERDEALAKLDPQYVIKHTVDSPGSPMKTPKAPSTLEFERVDLGIKLPASAPLPDAPLSRNWEAFFKCNRATAIRYIIQMWLASQDVGAGDVNYSDLFPQGWSVGKFDVPIFHGKGPTEALNETLPDIKAYNSAGREIHWLGESTNFAVVTRLKATWPSTYDSVRAILMAITGTKYTDKFIQHIPQKEQTPPFVWADLKTCISDLKAHINRIINPVLLRRDPKFVEVSNQYKAMVKKATENVQQVIKRRKVATMYVQRLLAERDAKLLELNPHYSVKHTFDQIGDDDDEPQS